MAVTWDTRLSHDINIYIYIYIYIYISIAFAQFIPVYVGLAQARPN